MVLLPQGLWLSFLRVYVVESLEILQLQYQRESTTTTILNLILILCVMCLRRLFSALRQGRFMGHPFGNRVSYAVQKKLLLSIKGNF